MIFYISHKIQREFQSNLLDWYAGGPKEGGWTRTGPAIPANNVILTSYEYGSINVVDGLAKNPSETERWHLNFLSNHSEPKTTAYYLEYLLPRYSEELAENRITTFLSLRDDVHRHGIKKPIWVADLSFLNMGFVHFRFDGCHRLCCAKYLGIESVPAIIFTAMEVPPDDAH